VDGQSHLRSGVIVLPDDFRARYEEKVAVIERIKAYIAPWMTDKRMKIMGQIMLREIERYEKEEAEKTERDGR
jgi:hypothetical protein